MYIDMKITDYVNQISYMVQQEIELFLINYKTYDIIILLWYWKKKNPLNSKNQYFRYWIK